MSSGSAMNGRCSKIPDMVIDRACGSLPGLMVGDAFGAQAENTPSAVLKELFSSGILEMDSKVGFFGNGTAESRRRKRQRLSNHLIPTSSVQRSAYDEHRR